MLQYRITEYSNLSSMAESPEVPEAKDPFEKKIALSIAIVAVVLALIGSKGDAAKTEAIIKTNQAADKWGEYQSKSIKQHIAEANAKLAVRLANIEKMISAGKPESGAPEKAEKAEKSEKSASDYEKEKDKIKEEALEFEHEASTEGNIENKLHLAEVLLQLAVVLSSIAILTRWHVPWFAGMFLALVGAIYGGLHYF